MVFICSCQNRGKTVSQSVIDDFVKRHQTDGFSDFKNVAIFIRQMGITSTTYILSTYDGNYPVYFVTYNELINKITEIDYSGMKEKRIDSYFSKSQIIFLVNKFRQTKFCLLAVDTQKNVYINPFYPNRPPFFLRKNKTAKLEMLRKSGDFIQYKDDWYINRSLVKATMHLKDLGK